MSFFPKQVLIYIKWHSNIPSLENEKTNSERTYAKQLFSSKSGHTRNLGLGCNKITDKINIEIPEFSERQITKRNVLSYVASIYDPLGLISAGPIIGKLVYCELCDLKTPWDEEIPDILKLKFKKWVQDISSKKIVLPRAIPLKLESVTAIDLHVFGDASILINCAAVYAVAYQSNITNKGLLVSKSRIAKKDVTIPRLELVSVHMGSNLLSNVLSALKTENITLWAFTCSKLTIETLEQGVKYVQS